MALEIGLISLTALSCLALSMKRHRQQIRLPVAAPAAVLRPLGWLLLGLSAAAAIVISGPRMGWVAWIGETSVAGAILVLLMSWRPAATPIIGLVALVSALALGLA